jgi:hypothetical protein
MLEYVMAYTKPDGTFPHIGDQDDGRLLPFGGASTGTHRPLLAIGAVLFNRSDMKAASGSWGPEAHWLLGKAGFKAFDRLNPGREHTATSKGFLEGGVFGMRDDDLHMVVDCADVGLRGRGGHGHNDCLSFELFAYDRTFITDSGTFRYAVPAEVRNRFRSTAAHNTAMVDGQEMARFISGTHWRIHDDAKPTLHLWYTSAEADVFDGSHSGFLRLPEPIRHRRRIIFDKRQRMWMLEDRFLGSGHHTYEVFFHFAPTVGCHLGGDSLVAETQDPDGPNLAIIPLETEGLRVGIRPGWVSTRYGAREEAPVACYTAVGEAPLTMRFCLFPSPAKSGYDVEEVRCRGWELVEEWTEKAPVTQLAGTTGHA